MRGLSEGVHLVSGVGASGASPAPAVVLVSVPEGFAHEEALKRLAFLIVGQLETGMREQDIAKRLHGRIEREG